MQAAVDPGEHLSIQLQRLDLLLHRDILRLRARYQLSLDEFRGLYISDEQVSSLIDQSFSRTGPGSVIDELTERAQALNEECLAASDSTPWQWVVSEFDLSRTDEDLLLLAMAPEIDLKYETLFAYLNNDVTRKWPTCDLACRLFAANAAEKLLVRRHLQPGAALFAGGLLQPIPAAAERSSWLSSGFSVSPLLASYVLGLGPADSRLAGIAELRYAPNGNQELPFSTRIRETLPRIASLFRDANAQQTSPVIVLVGRDGSGRSRAAEAVCGTLGLGLLQVDLEAARGSAESLPKLAGALLLQSRLARAGLYLACGDVLFEKEGRPLPETAFIIKTLAPGRGPFFFSCKPGTQWRELFAGRRSVCLELEDPDYPIRLRLWNDALTSIDVPLDGLDLHALSDRFALTPGQIAAAATAAVDRRLCGGVQPAKALDTDALFEAARDQSDQWLGSLAVKVRTVHSWSDLVLPRDTLQRVKEVASAIRFRHLVYSGWGFEDKVASGKGLKVLFAGTSGTGKTMTAGVIARDLGLDLYKIDLSGVVSKYIGETERNLDKIFQAADASNAMLFFDEADALFGKRSEIKDAHDRYANIEVAYLLQKIEEYEGVVVLASNLSKNIDDAFSRRMHYIIEFPLPGKQHREQLWRGMFPARAPVGDDVDFEFLAAHFPIAGGDIRNVVLDAAFLAAQDGQTVTMKQLIKAMARQMVKQGRIPSPTDFKQYHDLIGEDGIT